MERAKDEARVLMRDAPPRSRPASRTISKSSTNDTFLDIWKQISSLFASVVLGLASIALVVGGVVIMNIMLVSVTERTREIGVRKALGAKQRDVLLQFLIESASLALVGGAIGVIGGVLVGKVITLVVGFPTAVPLWAILLGLVPGHRGGHLLRRLPGQQSRQTGSRWRRYGRKCKSSDQCVSVQ